MLHRCVVMLALVVAGCSSGAETIPDAGVDGSVLPSESYACGAELVCAPTEYCVTFLPGACGGTPVGDDGECPPGCALCPSGVDCACPSYSCHAIPDDCAACECLDPPGGPACTCEAFGEDGVFVTCAGA